MLHVSQAVLVGWSQGSQDVAAYIQQFGTDSIAAVAFVDSPVAAGASEIEVNKEFSQRFWECCCLCTPIIRRVFRRNGAVHV